MICGHGKSRWNAIAYIERGKPMLVKIEVYNDGEFWCARGIGEDIFTQGQTVDELYANIKEAVSVHFEDGSHPGEIDILIVSELKLNHAPAATN
jgi:predicted RNase H-like HicB family nuclease